MVDGYDGSQQEVGEQGTDFSKIKGTVENIADQIVQRKFMNVKYESTKMQKSVNECAEELAKEIKAVTQDFKFITQIICLQKGETGFHMGASCFWDATYDGNLAKKFDFPDFYIILSLFGAQRH